MNEKFLDYRPAHLVKGKGNWYVAYSATNPETGKLVVKRVKLNYIKSARQRKEYADELIKQINGKLVRGYNPFFHENGDRLVLLSDAVLDFLKARKRDVDTRVIVSESFDVYKQHLRTFQAYINDDCFVFKIKELHVNNFLDDIYIERGLTAMTRNAYLATLRMFFAHCIRRGYIVENPARDIKNLKKGVKFREAIPEEVLQRIFNYLNVKGEKYYLLACYLLYSCFIRPSEICELKLSNISYKNQTIFISEKFSKNRKNQIVTMPINVARLMIDLEIYKYPSDYYIIGHDFQPSERKCTDKILRAKWLQVRKALQLPNKYQFYSLKDSGITKMLNVIDVAEVRDQARHSNIAITDVYTDRSKAQGNEHIKHLNFTPLA